MFHRFQRPPSGGPPPFFQHFRSFPYIHLPEHPTRHPESKDGLFEAILKECDPVEQLEKKLERAQELRDKRSKLYEEMNKEQEKPTLSISCSCNRVKNNQVETPEEEEEDEIKKKSSLSSKKKECQSKNIFGDCLD